MVATFDQDLIEQLRVKEKSLTALYYTSVYCTMEECDKWRSVWYGLLSQEAKQKLSHLSNSIQCDLDS